MGKKRSASGTIWDEKGHRLNGEIVVHRIQGEKNALVGRSRTAAGTYRVYDLEPGTYRFAFAARSGVKTEKQVVIEKGKRLTVNFRVNQ